MNRTRIIPVLLMIDGGLYKTEKFRNPKYIGDPINAVKIFNDKEVDELIILDISATKNRRGPNFVKIAEIAGEAFMPMAYGGGIHTFEDAKRVFDSGYEKIVINTASIESPWLIQEVASVYGAQSVVVSIDVKLNLFGKYKVFVKCGSKKTSLSPEQAASNCEANGAGEIMINAMHQDGTWEGYDLKLIQKVSNAVSIPVIACGGASCVNDLKMAVVRGGASAVAAGSMFVFQKKGMGVLISFPKGELEF
jgi:cyclase